VPSALLCIACISFLIWVYLVFARGGFWRLRPFIDELSAHENLQKWPSIVAIVPARNESETIAQTVASLARQDYPGELCVFIIDDHSEDRTAAIAEGAARENSAESRIQIHSAKPLPAGWTGKLWALQNGIETASQRAAEFYWFTDADIVHAPDTLRRLVSRAENNSLDLVSLMVLLQSKTFPERFLIPAFLFFFLKVYPPRWTGNVQSRTAGAAGGCVLLRRDALERSGGLPAISDEVIDDCALAGAVKRSRGKIWMGLTRTSVSLRAYRSFAEIGDMIARTAFTQLRYSLPLLAGTIIGMFLTYIAPVALTLAPKSLLGPHANASRILALLAWLLMSFAYFSTTRFYRASLPWVLSLPLAALFYSYATCVSAARYWRGRGGQWKGRSQA
jgi:hopene-associated glycosyltransferase HpnB